MLVVAKSRNGLADLILVKEIAACFGSSTLKSVWMTKSFRKQLTEGVLSIVFEVHANVNVDS